MLNQSIDVLLVSHNGFLLASFLLGVACISYDSSMTLHLLNTCSFLLYGVWFKPSIICMDHWNCLNPLMSTVAIWVQE